VLLCAKDGRGFFHISSTYNSGNTTLLIIPTSAIDIDTGHIQCIADLPWPHLF